MLGLGNLLTKSGVIKKFPNDFSFNFDGDDNYLNLGTIPQNHDLTLSASSNGSISAWIYIEDVSDGDGFKRIVDKSDGANGANGYAIFVNTDGTIGTAIQSVNPLTSDAGAITDAQWFHIAWTWDGSTHKLYKNGSLIKSVSSSSVPQNIETDMRIGSWNHSTAREFKGFIDEVGIWNATLSADDVAKIGSKPVDFSKASTYATDRTSNLKLWLRCGDKAEPESTTAIARQDFYTDFDGADDYIDLNTDLESWIESPNRSFTTWIKNGGNTDEVRVFNLGYDATGTGFGFGLDAGTDNKPFYFLRQADGTAIKAEFGDVLNTTDWYHFAITIDSSANEAYLYQNGVLKKTQSNVGTPSQTTDISAKIGTFWQNVGLHPFNGAISNLSLYNTTLDAQTISQMAKSRFIPMRDNRFSVVDFDGTNDYIDCGSDASLDNIWAGGGTLTAWIYPRSDGEGDFGMIAVKRNGNTSGWYLATNDESGGVCDIRLRSARDTADGGWATTSREITLNQWNHIAISYDSDSDSNNPLIYVNGISVGVTEDDTPSGSHSSDASDVFKIGGDAGDFTYDGSISSLAVYNVAKSAEEVYAIYQQGITYDESSLSGLVGYWRMGDDTSKAYSTIADSSSNSNDGTITNGASDDIVQQMVAGYDLGAFEGSEELGAELLGDGQFSEDVSQGSQNDNWNVITSGVANHEISNGRYRYTDSGTSTLRAKKNNNYISLELNKLHKLTFEIFDNNAYIAFATESETLIGNASYPVGTNTVYFTATASHSYFNIKPSSISASFSMDNVSLKEVLQSEVSDTYPAIIDVNEPVLGVEIFPDSNSVYTTDGSHYTKDSATPPNLTYQDTGTGTVTINDSDLEESINVSATFKLTFTISGLTSGQANFKAISTNSGNIYVDETMLDNGTHTFYFTRPAGGGDGFRFRSDDASGSTFTISDYSLKRVQGNVGTMTNQDSADLVYSSVLPDQSFLTGVNSAYNFIDLDGSDAYVDTGSIYLDTFKGSATISLWVEADDGQGSTRNLIGAINSGGSTTDKVLFQITSTGKVRLGYEANNVIGDGNAITNDVIFVNGQNDWKHLVCVINDTTNQINIYVNGDLQTLESGNNGDISSLTNSSFALDVNLYIGARNNGGTAQQFYNGSINQVAIWNKALSSSEISAIYNAGRHTNLLDSYSNNLKGYYAFGALDSKTGLADTDSTIYDRSGNSNHGTPSGTATGDLKSPPNAEPEGYAKGDTNRSTTIP